MRKNIVFKLPSEEASAQQDGYFVVDMTTYPRKGREKLWLKNLAPNIILFQNWKAGKMSTELFISEYKSRMLSDEYKNYIWALMEKSRTKNLCLVSYNKEMLIAIREVMLQIYKEHLPVQLDLFQQQ